MTSHLGCRVAQSVKGLGYMGWKIGGLNSGGIRDFCLLQNIHSDSQAHSASYWMLLRFCPGVECPGHEIEQSTHLVPRLRVSGSTSLFLHTFIEWRAATLHFTPHDFSFNFTHHRQLLQLKHTKESRPSSQNWQREQFRYSTTSQAPGRWCSVAGSRFWYFKGS